MVLWFIPSAAVAEIFSVTGLGSSLKEIYRSELAAIAYTPIPDEKLIAEQFSQLIKLIQWNFLISQSWDLISGSIHIH